MHRKYVLMEWMYILESPIDLATQLLGPWPVFQKVVTNNAIILRGDRQSVWRSLYILVNYLTENIYAEKLVHILMPVRMPLRTWLIGLCNPTVLHSDIRGPRPLEDPQARKYFCSTFWCFIHHPFWRKERSSSMIALFQLWFVHINSITWWAGQLCHPTNNMSKWSTIWILQTIDSCFC